MATKLNISKLMSSLPTLRNAGVSLQTLADKVSTSKEAVGAVIAACVIDSVILPFKNGSSSQDFFSFHTEAEYTVDEGTMLQVAIALLTMADSNDGPSAIATYAGYAIAYGASFPTSHPGNIAALISSSENKFAIDWKGQCIGDMFTPAKPKAPSLSKKVLKYAFEPTVASSDDAEVDLDSLMSDLLDF